MLELFLVRPPSPLTAPLMVVLFDPTTERMAPVPMEILPPMTRPPVFALIVWFAAKLVARLIVWVAVELLVTAPPMARA